MTLDGLGGDGPEGPTTELARPRLRGAVASDWGGADASLELPGASGLCLVSVPRGGAILDARARLSSALAGEIESPNHLGLVLLRTLREIEPRPYGFSAVLSRPGEVWVAVTPGSSVGLVRQGRIVEHCAHAAALAVEPGDRLVLPCCRLDPLLRDADELGRLVGADDPRATVLTLVEVGHLRGGTELSALVAEVDAAPDVGLGEERAGPSGLEDLLAALAPTLDALRRTPTPVPRARRVIAPREPARPPAPVSVPSAPPPPMPTLVPPEAEDEGTPPPAPREEPGPVAPPAPRLSATDTLSDDEDEAEEPTEEDRPAVRRTALDEPTRGSPKRFPAAVAGTAALLALLALAGLLALSLVLGAWGHP